MAAPSPPLAFNVTRRQTTLLPPSLPTPTDSLPLSDLDDHDGFRAIVPFIFFFAHHPAMADKDPADLIRRALSEALVHYYPLAGRLREGPGRKLIVECTSEGILFADADADIRLDELGTAPMYTPFPCMDELLCSWPESEKIVGAPLMLVQVTRLACKGFVLALSYNHAMADAKGLAQFLAAACEAAQGGAIAPPPWCRELLSARNPPTITRVHHGYNDIVITGDASDGPADGGLALEEKLHRSFFFGVGVTSSLRRRLHSTATAYSDFDVVAAVVWKCWAAAWGAEFADNDEVRFYFAVDARRRLDSPGLPVGYYGNVVVVPAAVTTAGELRRRPASFAAELIRKTKMVVDEEQVRSLVDLMVVKGRPAMVLDRAYCVSDLTRSGLGEVDFGWGEPVYGGPVRGGCVRFLSWSFHVKCGDGILVPLCFPRNVMERFNVELQEIISGDSEI